MGARHLPLGRLWRPLGSAAGDAAHRHQRAPGRASGGGLAGIAASFRRPVHLRRLCAGDTRHRFPAGRAVDRAAHRAGAARLAREGSAGSDRPRRQGDRARRRAARRALRAALRVGVAAPCGGRRLVADAPPRAAGASHGLGRHGCHGRRRAAAAGAHAQRRRHVPLRRPDRRQRHDGQETRDGRLWPRRADRRRRVERQGPAQARSRRRHGGAAARVAVRAGRPRPARDGAARISPELERAGVGGGMGRWAGGQAAGGGAGRAHCLRPGHPFHA